MKALTLTQPWATLVAIGAKRIETRSWPTNYRGPLAIHAAKGWTTDDRELCHVEPFRSVLRAWKETLPNHGMLSIVSALPHASIVAVANLARCFTTYAETAHRIEASDELPQYEYAFGNYEPGRYGFLLGDVRALREPVAARGMQGLWPVPADVEAAINAQLAAVAA